VKLFLRRLSVALVLGIIAMVVTVSPVLAIADPDVPPQVNAVYVYEDLLESGDIGVLVEYYLEYAVPPTETVTEAYLVTFVDTDGTTQLKTVAPYAFVDSGYGIGLAWIYFTAAEVATYSIDDANEALYRVWLTGNPTVPSGWTGDPPRTIVGVDDWVATGDGDPNVLLALRVLSYADTLELEWLLDMVEATSLGNKLTTVGESYFENVITNLRTMAPAAFSSSILEPDLEDIDYTTLFGATATGAIVVGTPVTLVEGANVLQVNATGTFILALEQGTIGTATSGTATINGSPVDLVAGDNTITVTIAPGPPDTVLVDVELQDTTTGLEDATTGTGFDLTAMATSFGLSRWWFSSAVWLILSVLICAAALKASASHLEGAGSGKMLFPLFFVCVVGGILLGLLKPVVGIVLFISIAGFFVGYILFFRGSNA